MNDVLLSNLSKIHHPKGDVLHAIKKSDKGFKNEWAVKGFLKFIQKKVYGELLKMRYGFWNIHQFLL